MAIGDTIVLKEWAVAVRALERGDQIVLMRKGGIVEETRDFRLESPAFHLFPTYEHQKEHLLKEPWRPVLADVIGEWEADRTVARISCYAEVTADLEVTSLEQLDRIRDSHIWTDNFVEERLKWKRTKPLHVLLLRVYALDKPQQVPVLDAYSGCKSWIRLETPVVGGGLKPVIDDERYERLAADIRERLS